MWTRGGITQEECDKIYDKYFELETKTPTSDSSGDEGDTNEFIVSYTSSTETLNITSNSATVSGETLIINNDKVTVSGEKLIIN